MCTSANERRSGKPISLPGRTTEPRHRRGDVPGDRSWRAGEISRTTSRGVGKAELSPRRLRKVKIPKEGGKTRQLSIPCIRDRVVQGALKLILEPIFEADFQPGSFGYRPKKSAHAALQRVSEAILRRLTSVIDFDLRAYFDTVRHHLLVDKVARRISDARCCGCSSCC